MNNKMAKMKKKLRETEVKKEKDNLIKKEKSEEGKREEFNANVAKKQDHNYLNWAFGIMATLIVGILVFSAIAKSQTKFEYEGLTFTKEKYEEIPVYHYSYFFNSLTGRTIPQ